MRIDRLKTLARYLERLSTIPPKKRPREFNLAYWACNISPEHPCGTASCAIGEACFNIPEFQEDGLTFDKERNMPRYGNDFNWSAVRKFFDISDLSSERLFIDDSYRTPNPSPKTVADRIRKLIRAQGKAS